MAVTATASSTAASSSSSSATTVEGPLGAGTACTACCPGLGSGACWLAANRMATVVAAGFELVSFSVFASGGHLGAIYTDYESAGEASFGSSHFVADSFHDHSSSLSPSFVAGASTTGGGSFILVFPSYEMI